jgi:hypothetical protein
VRKFLCVFTLILLVGSIFAINAQRIVPFTTVFSMTESGSYFPTTNVVIKDRQTYDNMVRSLGVQPEWIFYNNKVYNPDFTQSNIVISSYMQSWGFQNNKITQMLRRGSDVYGYVQYDSAAPNSSGINPGFGYKYQIMETQVIYGRYSVITYKSTPIAKQYASTPVLAGKGVTAIKLSTKSLVRYDALGRKTFMTPSQQKAFKKMTFQNVR